MARPRYLFRNPQTDQRLSYQFRVIGHPRATFRDVYLALLRTRWSVTLGVIVACYLALNALFALLYFFVGGVHGAHLGSYADDFFFSVQSMGTMGYGAMYPESTGANLITVPEAVVGLLVTALATGIVFVKFSRIPGRVVFARYLTIAPIDGVPTLMIRVGNGRSNRIYDAELRLVLARTVRTAEGTQFYRNEDLKLVRERAPTLAQSWTLLHRIDAQSPLHGATPESLRAVDAELLVALTGTDETTLQPVHGRYTYECPQILFGARPRDILRETDDGFIELDLRGFHDVVPTEPTAEFPYPISEAPIAPLEPRLREA